MFITKVVEITFYTQLTYCTCDDVPRFNHISEASTTGNIQNEISDVVNWAFDNLISFKLKYTLFCNTEYMYIHFKYLKQEL